MNCCKWVILALLGLLILGLSGVHAVAAEDPEPIIVKGDTGFRGVYHGFEVRLISIADRYVFDPQWEDTKRRIWEVTFRISAVTDEAKAAFNKLRQGEVFYKGTGSKTVEFPTAHVTVNPGPYTWTCVSEIPQFPKSFKNAADANIILGYSLQIPFSSPYKIEELRWNLQNVSGNAPVSKEIMGWRFIYRGIVRQFKTGETYQVAVQFTLERTTSTIREAPKFDLQNIRNDLKREFQYQASIIQAGETEKDVYNYQFILHVKEDDTAPQRKWSFVLIGVEGEEPQLVHFEFTLP